MESWLTANEYRIPKMQAMRLTLSSQLAPSFS